MPELYNPQKNITADVVVVGGGTAGVFAAISAAKTGADTLLIEKNSILGGTITMANVNFPGLFFAWGKQIISGPCWEAIERTIALDGAQMPPITFQPENHWDEQILVNRFIYTAVLWEMCREAGVRILTNTMLSGIKEEPDKVSLLITEKQGLVLVEAKVVIDATGDANLVMQAGYPIEKSKIQQPATLQNSLSGYVYNPDLLAEIRDTFSQAGLPEYLTPEDLLAYLRIHKLNMHIPCSDADTSEGRTDVEELTFSSYLKVYRYLKNLTGLKDLQLEISGGETGVRETNRIVGESTVTADDYIKGTRYPDSICYAFYPIDLHVMKGIEQTYHKENVVAKIPYSALVPKGSKRILCAGRCISSDTYANSAIRVEAPCMATGQAAGCAAALAAKNQLPVKEIPYPELCEALKSLGAIIPD